MALTPTQGSFAELSGVVAGRADQPSRTYRVDWQRKRVQGYTDGTEAMEQAILKILSTERFAYYIYSWNYGTEMSRVWGKSQPVVESELERVLREALLADDRIQEIRDFTLSFVDKRTASVAFTAVTPMGNIPMETEVRRYV